MTTELDCRYAGQSHELRVPTVDEFGAEHRRRNDYERPGLPIEVVALRAAARRVAPLRVTDLAEVERTAATGPSVIPEPDATIYVAEGWRAQAGPLGALVMTRDG